MLIKLVPESPHPSVLFAITFKNAPFVYAPDKPHACCVPEEGFSEKAVVMSAGWASQLDTLVLDDLDLPTSLHVLDRAAGIPTIIQEVALDVPSRAIRCSFIDGSVEEWIWPFNSQTPTAAAKRPVTPISAYAMQQYMTVIEGIINNVAQSAVEDERERQKDMYSSQQQEQEHPRRTSSEYSPLPSSKSTVKTHKKQRSFFMNIVASIVNLTPSAVHLHPRPPLPPSPKRSPSPLLIPLSNMPPPTPTCLKSPFPPLWTPPNSPIRQTLRSTEAPASAARTLRRQARSALVDAFRRFVLPEIVARASYGTYRNYHAINVGICGTDGSGKVGAGYYVWAIESMLRKASQRMDELANIATTTAVGAEKEKDRKIKSRIFPRFTVPRRKSVQGPEPATQTPSVTHYRRSAEIRAEQERQEAEYFTSTTQSIPPTHLFSDEEDSTEDGSTSPFQRKGSDTTLNGDDTDSVETETDGSSVHTPSSGHESLPPPASKPVRQSKLPLLSTRHIRNVSRIVSPTSIQAKGTLVAEGPQPGSLPPIEMAEYKALSRLSGKLQHLLFAAQARASQAENEARQRDATLEVRSQRRAWLNRTLRSWTPKSGGQGGIGNHTCTYGYISTCTMSTPNSSSPLARWTWTSEDWELASDICVEDDDDDIILQERTRFSAGDGFEQVTFGHPLRRGRDLMPKGPAMLFPVVEEEEEDWCRDVQLREDEEETLIGMSIGEDDELRELESGLAGFNLDVEAGEMAWDSHGEDGRNPNIVVGPGLKVMVEPERPRVRVRTSSMYESPFGRPQFQKTIDLSIEKNISPEPTSPTRLTSASLLCQPLTTANTTSFGDMYNSTQPVLAPPLMEKMDKSPPMICASFAGEIRDSDEFTLSMDLPPPMKGRSHISTFGTVPATQSLAIFAPTPQGGRQAQLSTVPDAR
ncbi:hypothetical protein M378DRAFT_12051 [Amanita muscaria Koide BX008]|uniref:Uncharacterized protein n=1 Tax=Amanita muscaria (strain Koide BX008) TaxID=946122 RepID=A0A0C2WPP6_AMAMK|nr:hypothetical protein M378DRAFT_12051 [Amanita muscaria Koide BX008]